MNDKLDIKVYIISLNKNLNIDSYKKYFNDITIYDAVDTRNHNVKDYFKNNIISFRAYNDFINGRKDHFGFAGIGAIGLYLTYKELFKYFNDKNIEGPILIFEEDSIINNPKEFLKKINLIKNKNYDVAIFGAKYKINTKTNISEQFGESNDILDINKLNNNELLKDFDELNSNYSNFTFAHSALWSTNGIKKMNTYLNKIIELQIDGFLSMLGKENLLDIKLEKNKTTSQKLHKSTLDNDNICKICDLDAKSKKYNLTFWDIIERVVILILCIFFISLIILRKS